MPYSAYLEKLFLKHVGDPEKRAVLFAHDMREWAGSVVDIKNRRRFVEGGKANETEPEPLEAQHALLAQKVQELHSIVLEHFPEMVDMLVATVPPEEGGPVRRPRGIINPLPLGPEHYGYDPSGPHPRNGSSVEIEPGLWRAKEHPGWSEALTRLREKSPALANQILSLAQFETATSAQE